MRNYLLGIGTLMLLATFVASHRAVGQETVPDFRRPANESELRRWLENMVVYHQFTTIEIESTTGMKPDEIHDAIQRFDLRRPAQANDAPLVVLPYPGGRHPRIGFLDGAIQPQRETKVSVFTPWKSSDYVVLDIPEAIWWNNGSRRELLYLAHTHIPTTWSRQGIELERLEWTTGEDGTLTVERKLPNGISFGTTVKPTKESVRMEMWLANGSDERLTGLKVQACVMFKGAPEFATITNDNKVFAQPYAACRSKKGDRWVITAWDPCDRVWGNPPCPCLHSDPQFPDCDPGDEVRLRGILSFYEGKEIENEFERIEATGWRRESK